MLKESKSKRIAVYPGSFDPATYGHLDIIHRSSKIFDELIVAVIANPNKKPFFAAARRIEMLKESINVAHPSGWVSKANKKNVTVESFSGLLVNFMKKKNASIIVRGLRAVSDFEYEFQMALTNRKLYQNIETVFLTPAEKWTYLSSTLVKEIAFLGGSVKCFVPKNIEKALKSRK